MKNLYPWLKAWSFLLVIFLVCLTLAIVQIFNVILSAMLSIMGDEFDRYNLGIWMMIDYVCNFILGGWPGTTMSSEIGAWAMAGSATGLRMERVVNWLFYVGRGEVSHCRNAMKADDLHFTTPKVRALSISGYLASIFTIQWIFA